MPRQTHFDRVRALVSAHSSVPEAEITPETRLLEDLGMDGDDGHDFLTAFADEFGVDLSRMAPFNYFDDEPPFSGASSLIPLAALLSPRFRAYVRHVARGRRPLTIRDLVASARAGRWITPRAGPADPTRFTLWPGLVLGGSIAFPLGLGLWDVAYRGSSPAGATAATLFVMTLLWALLGLKFLHSLSWLRRLDAAASFEEQAQQLSAAR